MIGSSEAGHASFGLRQAGCRIGTNAVQFAIAATSSRLNFDVAVADDFTVATVERDFAALDLGDHSEAVVLASNTEPASSNGASVSVASIGCRRFGKLEVRLIPHPSRATRHMMTSAAARWNVERCVMFRHAGITTRSLEKSRRSIPLLAEVQRRPHYPMAQIKNGDL